MTKNEVIKMPAYEFYAGEGATYVPPNKAVSPEAAKRLAEFGQKVAKAAFDLQSSRLTSICH